jgi:hypothetical protein
MNFSTFLKGKSPETYLDEKLKICGNFDELPRELNNCSCCERHKINFPILGNRIVSKEYTVNFPQKECKCPCRHIARMICREWELVNEVDECETSDEESEESDSTGSLEDFIVPDEGITKKERKKLDRALQHFRGKKSSRR